MAHAQPGIFSIGTRAHQHLQFTVTGDALDVLERIRTIRDGAGTVIGANVVVGFGPSVAARIWPDEVPTGLTDFTPIVGVADYTIPADQHDLWLWIHGATVDGVLDVANGATKTLTGVAELVAEEQAFVYRNGQDLTGFEDGTENPPLDEAIEVAVVPDGQPGAGGSVTLLQRWVHHTLDFFELSVDEQQHVFGTTLADSEEIPDLDDTPDAHVARVVIEDDDGEELEVFRRSTSYGGVGEHGLMFLAFSADRDRLQRMLERMAGVDDGIRDRLTEFSTATASAWYFTPPVELLRA